MNARRTRRIKLCELAGSDARPTTLCAANKIWNQLPAKARVAALEEYSKGEKETACDA